MKYNATCHALRNAAIAAITSGFVIACSGEPAPTNKEAAWPSFEAPAADASRAAEQPLPRACSLVTEAEAAEVLGQPVGLMGDDPENCVWASAGNPGRITMLMVQILREDSPEKAETIFGSLTGLSGQLNAMVNAQLGERTRKSGQEIEGLGDAAWRATSNADLIGTEQLVARKAHVVLNLNITGMTKTGKLDGLSTRLESAAHRAIERF